MKALLFTLTALFVSSAALAEPAALFTRYETVRQALLRESVADAKSAAGQLAGAAQAEKQPAIAAGATAITKAADLAAVRTAFAALSAPMIAFRNAQSGTRPIVAYCSMEDRSWLQPAGAIGNPYVGKEMRSCGEVKQK